LDFKQLRENYVKSKTKKVNFAKSSFLHFAKNNYVYSEKYGGHDTVLTMELVQEPLDLNYKELKADDPNKIGSKCSNGDPLALRFKPRERAPYDGSPTVSCDVCHKGIECYRGWYCCPKADEDCSFDLCQNCYKGKRTFE